MNVNFGNNNTNMEITYEQGHESQRTQKLSSERRIDIIEADKEPEELKASFKIT